MTHQIYTSLAIKFIHFYLFCILLLHSYTTPIHAITTSVTCLVSTFNFTQNTTVLAPSSSALAAGGPVINATNPLIVNNTYQGVALQRQSSIGSYIITYNDTGISVDGLTFDLNNGFMILSSINGTDSNSIYANYFGTSTTQGIEMIGAIQGGTGKYSNAVGSVFIFGVTYQISKLSDTLYSTTGRMTLTATILIQSP